MAKPKTETPEATILVLGDVILDTIILAQKKSGELSDELSRNVSSYNLRIRRPGGTLLLRNVIKEAVWYNPPSSNTPPSSKPETMRIPEKPAVAMKPQSVKGASIWDFKTKDKQRLWGRLITYDDHDFYRHEKNLLAGGGDGNNVPRGAVQNDLTDPDYYVSHMSLSVFPQSLGCTDNVYRIHESTRLGYLYSRSQAGDKKWEESWQACEKRYKDVLYNKIYALIEAKNKNSDFIAPSIVVIDDLNLGFRKYRPPGFDLDWMPTLNDVSGIPKEGKNRIIVAAVNDVLHFRIFDGDGKFKDTDQNSLTEQAPQIEVLRKQLKSLWLPPGLTWSEKDHLITAVTSIVGHTPPPTDQDDKGKGEQILSFLRGNPHFDSDRPDGFIVWRMEYPLADGDLWAAITAKYADRTILIVSGENLREAGIDMRDEDPLEQKAHALHHLLEHSNLAKALSQCNRIIIRFNNGVLQYTNKRGKTENVITAHYHPLVDGKTMDGSHDLGRMIGYTHVLTAAVVKCIAYALKYGQGFDLLRLMPTLNDVSGIPKEGKNRIIVAAVNDVLHFRIFDGDGKFKDTDQNSLTEQAPQIEVLREQLKSLRSSHELTWSEKERFMAAVTSIVGDRYVQELLDNSFEERVDSYISAGLRLGVVLGYRLFEGGFAEFGLEQWDKLEDKLGRKWKAGEVPRPLERVFWEWDGEHIENNGFNDRHVINLCSCDLPGDFINYPDKSDPLGQPWNRVEDYCAVFAKTKTLVSDAPETAAIAIVLQGLQQISKTRCERVYEEMHKESWGKKEVADVGQKEYDGLDKSIQVKIDAIRQIRETVSNQFMPPWAPQANIFLPYVKFGKIESIDREEIIGLFSIKSLMENYRMNKEWLRPLSIAVFGPPGSGKSFTIRELLSTVDAKAAERPKVEFNLAQFSSVADLAIAFHQVQDQALADVTQTPMIVFDEFDTDFHNERLGWLHSFLMPMQDGLFKAGENTYRIGRVIFVFTGGTYTTFDKFYDDCMGNALPRGAKGPDFISRLRGYLDIKKIDSDEPQQKVSDLLMFRRAILLRSLLDQNLATIIDKDTKYARMDRDVIRAFLTIPQYKHGVRSMEAIIQMARISRTRLSFQKASLPPPDQLKMHVDADQFHRLVYGYLRFRTERVQQTS